MALNRRAEQTLVWPVRRARNRRVSYRPVFVAGVGGSGTSLAATQLYTNFDFAGFAYEGARWVRSGSPLRLDPLDSHESITAFETRLRIGSAPDPQAVVRDTQWLYRSVAVGLGDHVVDKGPNAHMYRVQLLAAAYPGAPFVCVVRDPVATVEGLRRKWRLFGRAPLAEVCRFVAEAHRACFAAFDRIASPTIVLRYEDVVAGPEHLARLESGPLPPRVAPRPVDRSRGQSPGKGLRNAPAGRVTVVPGANAAALRRLADEEREFIDARLGWLREEGTARARHGWVDRP